MSVLTRDDKIGLIVDHADAHLEKVEFAQGVMDLSGVFALGPPQVFTDIVEDLAAEVEESAELGNAMIAMLDAPIQ